nr:DUF362 domain-containing protein [Desulfobacterales bacterium]
HREVVILGDQEMEIGEAVFDADFVINIPVMKTHAQTRVTLGLKNLKGCLAPESKKKCHIELNLHNAIAEFNTHIPCDLVVLDALTAMETGPTPVKEDSVKEMGLILASKDRLECDVVGSYLLGYEAASVPHIARYAELVGRSADLEKVEVLGEDIDQYRLKLDYYFNWAEHMIENFDIKGLRMPYYGDHLCSACGFNLYAGLLYFCRENRGASFDNVEFCSGLSVRPSKGAKKVALLGKCAVKANKGLKDAIKIGACPPDPKKMAEKLTEALNK